MEFNPDRTAVVVVDMQNDFAHPDGALFSEASADVVDPITDLVTAARNAGATVVYTRDVHPTEQFEDAHYYDEFDRWGEHVVEGTWGAELLDDLDVRDEDHVVDKHTYDAFHQTDLDGFLSAHGIDDLLICGTLANVCVLHTASSAGLRDYRPVIVSDALGYITEDHKEYSVEHADFLFGETATTADVEFHSDV